MKNRENTGDSDRGCFRIVAGYLDPRRIEVIDDEMAAVLRAMTPAQRLASANGMWEYARGRLLALVRHEHPDWDEARVKAEVCRRLLESD